MLGYWVAKDRARSDSGDALEQRERAELGRLCKENTELRMQREVLKRLVVGWVNEAMGR